MKLQLLTMALALSTATSFAQNAEVDADATLPTVAVRDGDCPRKTMGPPIYPADAYRRGRTGTATVSVLLDRCGRVIDARVVKSSGTESLDQAALEAARKWVLGDVGPEKLVDGRVESPVSFEISGVKPATARNVGWPATHRRPQYVLEPASRDFALVDAAMQAADAAADTRIFPPPYPGITGRFLVTGSATNPEFWLLPYLGGRIGMAARYRPVIENGMPVVRLLVVCDEPAEICAKDSDFLLRGLPFAKAKK